jgi:C1A family cysteine protease
MSRHILSKDKLTIIIIILVSATMIASAAPQIPLATYQAVVSFDPPSHFDLRDVNGTNYVTVVRDQGPFGTCWTHGVMASMESNLMMTGNWAAAGETDEPDLSEAHLDWWNGFNTNNNDDDPGGGGLTVHEGGDYRVASAYLTRGEGAIRENDAPYQYLVDPCDRFSPYYHYFYPHDIEWYSDDQNLSNINTIKSNLMKHGAIGTAICYDDIFITENYTFYQPPSNPLEPNHAVTIVGWDDTLVTQAPEGPGAWIVKNSWNTWWGDEGYFYISFYDKCAGKHPEMGAVSYQGVKRLSKDVKIYSHDYHGWRDTFMATTEVVNAFTAVDSDHLMAVSFYTTVDNASFVVKVYRLFEDGQLQDEVMSVNGSFTYIGYHTVDFPENVPLTAGSPFYLYLCLSNGGVAFDRTSDVPVLLGASSRTIVKSIAHPGESYYKQNGTWLDLYSYAFPDSSWDGTANFCLKAITRQLYSPLLEISNVSGGKWITFQVSNIGNATANNTIVDLNLTGHSIPAWAAGDTREYDLHSPHVWNRIWQYVSVSISPYFCNR